MQSERNLFMRVLIFSELLVEVNSMISYELNNVKQQRLILTRKLELIDNIDDQYKEQIRLLSQLVSNVGDISV